MTVTEWIGSGLVIIGVSGLTYILFYTDVDNQENQNSENNDEIQSL